MRSACSSSEAGTIRGPTPPFSWPGPAAATALPAGPAPGDVHAWHLYVLRLAGLVDMEQVYIPTTYLWATALGGVGVGAGMGDPTAMGNEAAMAGAMMASLGVMGISLLAALFVTAFFINLLVKSPDGQAIGYGRSCLVSLLYLVAMVVLGFVASIVIGIIIGMMGVGAAAMAG